MENRAENSGSKEESPTDFEVLMERIKVFCKRRQLFKLSAYTSGLSEDTLGFVCESPDGIINFEGSPTRVRFVITEEVFGQTITRKLHVVWSTQKSGTEAAVIPKSREEYNAEEFSQTEAERLNGIIELYEEIARSIPPEEAKSLGFNDEFVASLEQNQQTS